LKKCIVCGIRCDTAGKDNLMELKTYDVILKINTLQRKNTENPKIGDLVCRKHDKQLIRNEQKSTLNEPLHSFPSATFNETTFSFESESVTQSYSLEENDIHTGEQSFHANSNQTAHEDLNENEPSIIMVDMPRTYASHSFCFICKEKSGI
jgi:hypothetical protein